MRDFHLNLATQLIGSYNSQKHAACPYILPAKFFAIVSLNRNPTTNVTSVTTATPIR